MTNWRDEFYQEFGELVYAETTTEMANRHIKSFIQDLLDRKAEEIEGLKSPESNPVILSIVHNKALDQAISILKEE